MKFIGVIVKIIYVWLLFLFIGLGIVVYFVKNLLCVDNLSFNNFGNIFFSLLIIFIKGFLFILFFLFIFEL